MKVFYCTASLSLSLSGFLTPARTHARTHTHRNKIIMAPHKLARACLQLAVLCQAPAVFCIWYYYKEPSAGFETAC